MHRIPNTEVLEEEKNIVRLILNFGVVSFKQMYLYHVYTDNTASMDHVISKMRHLASKYHFSCFEVERCYALNKTDLSVPWGIAPMWIYLDFLQLKVAGAVNSTNIPYTPVIFEQTDESQLIEIVCVPETESEIQKMNQELFLYDSSLGEQDEKRRRVLLVAKKEDAKHVRVKHAYIGAHVSEERVEYFEVEEYV